MRIFHIATLNYQRVNQNQAGKLHAKATGKTHPMKVSLGHLGLGRLSLKYIKQVDAKSILFDFPPNLE